jgi:coatomer subunit beta
VPILASEQRLLEEMEGPSDDSSKPVEHKPSTTTRVLADGTYATETVYSSTVQEKERIAKIRAASKAPLRALLLAGDFYTGSVLSSSITKLVLRLHKIATDQELVNSLRAEVGLDQFSSHPFQRDPLSRPLSRTLLTSCYIFPS